MWLQPQTCQPGEITHEPMETIEVGAMAKKQDKMPCSYTVTNLQDMSKPQGKAAVSSIHHLSTPTDVIDVIEDSPPPCELHSPGPVWAISAAPNGKKPIPLLILSASMTPK